MDNFDVLLPKIGKKVKARWLFSELKLEHYQKLVSSYLKKTSMEDILYSAKEANQFKDTNKKVYFVNCPVCEKKGFRLTHYMYCSKECEFKVITARKWIEDNKYAKIGDYVEIDGVKGIVRSTTMSEIKLAQKPDLNIHNYRIEIDDDGEYIILRDVTSFLLKC